MSDEIRGTAYGRAASLEIAGDTLRWRAVRGFQPIAENIVTTVHDVRAAHWIVQRVSWIGILLAALGTVWLVRDSIVAGIVTLAAAVLFAGWRIAKPRRALVLELTGTRLVLVVEAASAGAARALAERIDHAIATGEVPSTPPMLP
jgi:hypothetical protein